MWTAAKHFFFSPPRATLNYMSELICLLGYERNSGCSEPCLGMHCPARRHKSGGHGYINNCTQGVRGGDYEQCVVNTTWSRVADEKGQFLCRHKLVSIWEFSLKICNPMPFSVKDSELFLKRILFYFFSYLWDVNLSETDQQISQEFESISNVHPLSHQSSKDSVVVD